MSNRIRFAAVYLMACVPMMPGQTPRLLQINPSVEQFNATGVGSTVTNNNGISIGNTGTSPVTITGIGVVGADRTDFTVLSGCPISPSSLMPGYTCYLTVSFTPSATGLRLAQVVVKDVGGATQTVLLAGEGLAATKGVSFSPVQAVFPDTAVGLPPQNAPTAYIQVRNTGSVSLNIQLAKLVGGDVQDFQITFNSCNGYALPPGSYCSVTLAFTPTAVGNRTSSLEIIDDAPGSPQKVPLLGVGSVATDSLQLFPAAIAFAPEGTTSNEQATVTVQNTGSEVVTINNFQVTGQNATDFTLVQNFCQPLPYTLPPFTQCDVWLQFTPGAYGERLATLEVLDSVPGSPQKVPLEGIGTRPVPTTLKFTSDPVNFGVQMIGSPYYGGSANLQNLGSNTAQIVLQVEGLDPGDFYVTNNCSYLYAGGSCYIPITFTAGAAGLRLARLMATDSVSGATQSVELIGSGVPTNVLSVASPFFSPTPVGGTNTSQMNISNYNSSSVTITSMVLIGGNAADFSILQNNCPIGTPLNSYYSCTVTFTFTPRMAGARVTQLNINYAGGSTPISVPVDGFGEPSSRSIVFNTASLDFGALAVGTTATNSASIQNSGTVAVAIDSISVRGPQAGDYAITGNNCPQPPATLAPAASCQVNLQFTPPALGTRVAQLQVTDNAAGSPQNLPLIGFGVVAGVPALQISPTTLNFNAQPLGSPFQQSISVNNFTTTPITLSSVTIVGVDASDFSLVNNCPTILTQYTFCEFYITFTPSVTGERVAALQLQDNAAGAPQVIPLAGMGEIAAQSVSLSPNPLAFTQVQAIGYSTSNTVIVSNAGTENVLLSGFKVHGRNTSDFGIQSNTCPLNPAPLSPGQSCQVTITFKPSAAGVRVATFQVMDSAPGGSQSIGIVGEGTAAVKTLQANPASVSFYPVPVGSTEYGPQITILNTGTAPVTFKGFSVSGANGSDFSVGYNFCVPYYAPPILNPGSSCSVSIDFTPSATGTRTGQLNVTSDASNSPLVVSLTGTGE